MNTLDLNFVRRFGAEIELNSFDLRNRPLGYEDGALPDGIYSVGNLVHKTTNHNVSVHKWGYDHYNEMWVIKPDASCGIEVCTPVLKGWQGLMQVCRVTDAFGKSSRINADNRCSFHVHIDVSDLSNLQLAAVLTWWIKCEPVFLDSVPHHRKINQYCQILGTSELFDDVEDGFYSPNTLISKLGSSKYFTLNTYHLSNNKRTSIEFRIMDSNCCLNPWMTKNWIRLILHFIQRSLVAGMPRGYKANSSLTGYCWLDPMEVFEFLGFLNNDLSPGLQQVRKWFVSRLYSESKKSPFKGIMGDAARSESRKEINALAERFGIDGDISDEEIYGDNFRI